MKDLKSEQEEEEKEEERIFFVLLDAAAILRGSSVRLGSARGRTHDDHLYVYFISVRKLILLKRRGFIYLLINVYKYQLRIAKVVPAKSRRLSRLFVQLAKGTTTNKKK